MTDENDDRIAALFRAAASDSAAPPPGFGHDDVLAASRRITVRRRSALVAGAFVLLAAVGVGSVIAIPRDSGATTSAAAPAPQLAREGAAGADAVGEAPSFAGAPLGPGTTECADRQDPALRALLDQALPEAAGATEAATTDICLPGGERGVNLEVTSGGVPGLLVVTYLPPGTVVSLPVGDYHAAPTASGGTVIVGSDAVGPTGGPAPFADRLPAVLAFLAPRL
jgi:hypothetical protein